MKETKDVTAMVVDHGLFCCVAQRLARDFRRVLYHVPNQDDYIKWNNSMVGHGIENIEVVNDVFCDDFEYCDLFVFPDCGFGPLQTYLDSIGKKVWGSRMGEDLELERVKCKQILKDVGLPVGKYEVVTGMKNLREYLKKNPNQYVKISRYRGTVESFHVTDYKTVEPLLSKIEYDLGPLKDIMEFIVEEDLPDKCELGMDTYTIAGNMPSKAFGGLEVKNCGFAGIFQDYTDFPEPLRIVDSALAEIFESYNYNGPYSTECRIGKDGVPYLIDFTARNPMPPTPIYLEMFDNYSEIVWQGANGNLIDPEYKEGEGPYGMQLILKSDWGEQKNWQPIDFDEEDFRWIKVSNPCIINDQWYAVPLMTGLKESAHIVGLGKSFEECKKKIKKIADNITGYSLDIPLEELDKAQSQAKECEEKYGVKMF